MVKTYSVIGVMSGTSLDGVDLLYCSLKADRVWSFHIHTATTYRYSKSWVQQLNLAHRWSLPQVKSLDKDYTKLLAELINRFIKDNKLINIDFIASHGHTIWHQPEEGQTYQIGNLSDLASLTGQKVVCDFRVQDVALGGQGAPLVPIGDRLLFGEFDACVNLGGFANISFEKNHQRIAYDICPVNKVLNVYASKLEKEFDKGGAIARASVANPKLLTQLEKLQFYSKPPPKSLGIEWLEAEFLPVLNLAGINSEDVLATCTQHFAYQVAKSISDFKTVLFTGGGVFNTYLMELISAETEAEIVIPEPEVINYKEALIFAFLGVLKVRGEDNVLASVTGAPCNHSSGSIYKP